MALEVRLVAVPEPELVWYFNGEPLTETDDLIVSDQSDMHSYVSILDIRAVKKREHEGVFTIVAKNREGEAKMDIPVKVRFHLFTYLSYKKKSNKQIVQFVFK